MTASQNAVSEIRSTAEMRRQQILDAAAKCFVERGFHSAGMAMIAKESKMSVGHIYHYFANKNDIIAALVEQEANIQSHHFEQFRNVAPEQFLEVLTERIEESVRRASDPFQSVLIREMLAESQRNPRIAEIIQKHDKRARDTFCMLVEDKLGISLSAAMIELIFAIFSGIGLRVIKNPDLDKPALTQTIRTTIRQIFESESAHSH